MTESPDQVLMPVASESVVAAASPIFGGYNNNTTALTATAADGAGLYAVVGTNGAEAYLAIHSSADHARLCETAFVPVDPGDPLHIYDQGQAFGAAWGNGLVYVAGEAHDTTSTPDDFDGFVQVFSDSCQKVGDSQILGYSGHDAFKAVAVSAAGVFVAGYLYVENQDQIFVGRLSFDLTEVSYYNYYRLATEGGNHANAIAVDDAGQAYVGGFIRYTPVPTEQRLFHFALTPDGNVRWSGTADNSGPSEYTSVRIGANRTISFGGTAVDTSLGTGPFGTLVLFGASDPPILICNLAFPRTLGAFGMDVDRSAAPVIHLGVFLNPLISALPSAIQPIDISSGCGILEAVTRFGSTNGQDSPGGLAYDPTTNTVLTVASTTGSNYTPNTDGSRRVGRQNGYLAAFALRP